MASILEFLNSFGISDLSEDEKENGVEEMLSQIDFSAIKGTVAEELLLNEAMKTRGEFKFSADGKKLERYKGEDIIVSIPKGITEIGKFAFSDCSKMVAVDIPYGVDSIGEDAFLRCKNLLSIELPNSVQIIEHEAFNGCSKATIIDLPDSLKVIRSCAFNFCESLEKIYIPSSVEIFEDTFYHTPSLQEIHVSWRNLNNINIHAFDRINSREGGLYGHGVEFKECVLYVPHGMMHAYRHHPAFREFATIIPE